MAAKNSSSSGSKVEADSEDQPHREEEILEIEHRRGREEEILENEVQSLLIDHRGRGISVLLDTEPDCDTEEQPATKELEEATVTTKAISMENEEEHKESPQGKSNESLDPSLTTVDEVALSEASSSQIKKEADREKVYKCKRITIMMKDNHIHYKGTLEEIDPHENTSWPDLNENPNRLNIDMNAEEKVDKADDMKNVKDKVKEEIRAKKAVSIIMDAILSAGPKELSPMRKRLQKRLEKKKETKSTSVDPKSAEPAQNGMPNTSASSSGKAPMVDEARPAVPAAPMVPTLYPVPLSVLQNLAEDSAIQAEPPEGEKLESRNPQERDRI